MTKNLAAKTQKVQSSRPEPPLLEQVRNVMRLHHYSIYSIHTERSYLD